MYEHLTNAITEEEFEQAVKDYLPNKKKKATPIIQNEVVDVSGRVNPDAKHKFPSSSAWSRCIYCNSIRKYVEWKECPKYSKNLGTTDTESE